MIKKFNATIQCDYCQNEIEVTIDDITETNPLKKVAVFNGYVAIQSKHVCPDCYKKIDLRLII